MMQLCPELMVKSFKDSHCVLTTYVFQVKKCMDKGCGVCTPVRFPPDVFDDLHFIPAPLLNASKEYFRKFSTMYSTKPTEKDKPSLKFSIEAITEDKGHKSILVSEKVCAVIPCNNCRKPQCIYSDAKSNLFVRGDKANFFSSGGRNHSWGDWNL